MSQQKNGGQWVRQGVFGMRAGDRAYVRISRKNPAKGYIIAYAIRVMGQ